MTDSNQQRRAPDSSYSSHELSGARGVALMVRFIAELGMLAGAGVWTWNAVDGGWRWVAVVAAPVVLGVIWGLFLSPKAKVPIPEPWRVVVETVLFGAVAAGLASVGFGAWGVALFVLWAADRIALRLLA